MRVIAIAAESSDIVAAVHISSCHRHVTLSTLSRHFVPDVRPDVCTDAVAAHGQYADTPSASGTVNRVVQGVIIHPGRHKRIAL